MHINAGLKDSGMNYSHFMCGLRLTDVGMSSEALASMAKDDSKQFQSIVQQAKKAYDADMMKQKEVKQPPKSKGSSNASRPTLKMCPIRPKKPSVHPDRGCLP